MAAKSSKKRDILHTFNSLTKDPEEYIRLQKPLIDKFKKLTKECYDFEKKYEDNLELGKNADSLPHLIIDGFDEEQIWQELDLQNMSLLSGLSKLISKNANNNITFGDVDKLDDVAGSVVFESDDEPLNDESSDDEINHAPVMKKKPKTRHPLAKSLVDDQFFKLNELEEFLTKEDIKFEKKSDDESSDDEMVDLFVDDHSDSEAVEEEHDNKGARNATYEDFFDPPETDEVADPANESSEEDEDEAVMADDMNSEDFDEQDVDDEAMEEDEKHESEEENQTHIDSLQNESLSKFEKQKEIIEKKIQHMEKQNIATKPWQLRGEITALERPENCLLEEHLHFDHQTKQAPIITEETTKSIEDIVIQRIKDKSWDDVERKTKPVEEPFEYRKRVVLDQEKSKKSLAEIYEEDYLSKKKNETEENQDHTHIKNLMSNLFSKLDALAHFHYMPKPPAPDVKIVNNLPALTVEEVAPVHISDANLLAPEEVKEKSKRDLIGDTEKSKTEKKAERRLKKKNLREKRKIKEAKEKNVAKLQTSTKNKFTKTDIKKVRSKEGKEHLKSSKAFFEKLQDEVTSKVHPKEKKKPNFESKKSISKLKL